MQFNNLTIFILLSSVVCLHGFRTVSGPATDFRLPGPNGAASNEQELSLYATFTQTQNLSTNENDSGNSRRRNRRQISSTECCKKVLVTASGPAGDIQWDRMGVYSLTGELVNGRHVYVNENGTQNIFYLSQGYNGWMLGPKPGENFGAIKNNHDQICLHDPIGLEQNKWSYYGGNQNTKNPREAFPYWAEDDASLEVRCVPQTVYIDSTQIRDTSRAMILIKIYRFIRPILLDTCGSQLSQRMNIDAWTIQVACGGICDKINVTVSVLQGKCDLMLLWSAPGPSVTQLCEGQGCTPDEDNLAWTKRLVGKQTSSYEVRVGSDRPRLYAIIVGYTEYVSASIKIDALNLIRTDHEIYEETFRV